MPKANARSTAGRPSEPIPATDSPPGYPVPTPLPSIADIGRHMRSLLDSNDARFPAIRAGGPGSLAAGRMSEIASDREEALSALAVTLRPVTAADAVVLLFIAWNLVSEVADFHRPKEHAEQVAKKVGRILVASIPVVAHATGVDLFDVTGNDLAGYADRIYPSEIRGMSAADASPAGAPHPDAALLALCGQIEAVSARGRAFDTDGATPIADEDEREAVQEPIRQEQNELLERMLGMRAATLEGVIALGRVIAAVSPDTARDGGPGDYQDTRMIAGLLRNLLELSGRG